MLSRDKSMIMRRSSQNTTVAAQSQVQPLSNVTKVKPFAITQTNLPQAVAAAQQSNKAWRDILRTPILKVKKAPPSLVPMAKETGVGEQPASMTNAKPIRTSAQAKHSVEHTTPVKASNKSTRPQQLSHSQVNVKQAPRSTNNMKSEIAKIKEIIEKEEGLQEISNSMAEKQKEMKAVNSFEIVKKQRGMSQSKHRPRPIGAAALISQTMDSKGFAKQ